MDKQGSKMTDIDLKVLEYKLNSFKKKPFAVWWVEIIEAAKAYLSQQRAQLTSEDKRAALKDFSSFIEIMTCDTDEESYYTGFGTPIKKTTVETIKQALSSPPEWNFNMDEAPKDGTEIILCSTITHDMGICYWRDDKVMTGWTWGLEKSFGLPIAWQHLPAAPKVQE